MRLTVFPTCLILAALAPAADVVPQGPILALDSGGHTAPVQMARFTPDGRSLVTVASDKTVRVWDLGTGTCRRVLRPPVGLAQEGRLYAVAVSPDGKRLAVGGFGVPDERRGRILLIDLEAGEVAGTLDGHDGAVFDLQFSPDGTLLASCDDYETAHVWDLATGKTRHRLRGHTQRVQSLAFSPDGTKLATASLDATGGVWDVATGKRLATLEGHEKGVLCVAWSRDGRQVATGGLDHRLILWRADGRSLGSFPNRGNEVHAVAFGPDPGWLLYTLGGAESCFECRWLEVSARKVWKAFTRHTNSVVSVAFSPDGKQVATAGGDAPDVYVWGAADGEVVHHLSGRTGGLRGLGWTADSKAVAFGATREPGVVFFDQPVDRSFHLEDLRLGPAPAAEKLTRARVDDGTYQLGPGGPSTLNVLRGERVVARLSPPVRKDFVASGTFLGPDRAAVGSQLGVFLFETATGKLTRRFRGHTATVYNLAPSPDGKYFASASDDQTLRVWVADREDPLLSLFFAGSEWIAWTPEGYYACSPAGSG